MSHYSADIDAPWAAHLQPWVSSNDSGSPVPTGEPLTIAADAQSHPISTNSDHTGLRDSLDQFRLPRNVPSVTAA